MAVLTLSGDSEYERLAADIAADRDDRVVRDVNNVAPDSTLYYVDPPDALRPSVLDYLVSLSLEHRSESLGFGVITGRTPREARELYRRDRTESGAHCMSVATESVSTDDSGLRLGSEDDRSGLRFVSGDDATTERLAELDDDGLASLSLVADGKNMHVYLEDGFAVGFPDDPESFAFDAPQPPYIDASQSPPTYDFDRNVLVAESLDIPHLFFSGCSGLLQNLNDGRDSPVHFVLSVLATAQSFVGSYRIMDCVPRHGALHNALLRAGYAAGEQAYVLNADANATGAGRNPYVVAGRVDAAVDSPESMEYATTLHREDGTCVLTVEDVDAPLIDVQIPNERLPNAEQYYLRARETTDDPLFYTTIPGDDHVRVLVYAWDGIRTEQLSFEIGTTSYVRSDELPPALRALPRSVTEASKRANSKLVRKTNKLNEARNLLQSINPQVARERYDPEAHFEIREKLERCGELLCGFPCSDIGDGVVSGTRRQLLDNRPFADRNQKLLRSEYGGTLCDVADADVGERCPYCGSHVYCQGKEDVFGETERYLGNCENCAYVFDAPRIDGECRYPTLHGEFYGVEGGTLDIDVRIANPLDRWTDAVCLLTVFDDYIAADEVVSDARRTVALDENETASVTYELDADRLLDLSRRDAVVSVEPDWSHFGPTFGDRAAEVVGEIEALVQRDPTRLDADAIEVPSADEPIPTDSFDGDVTELTDTYIYDFFTVEVHVVTQDLNVFTGMRTIHFGDV